MPTDNSPTAAQRLLELSASLGVEFIFTNLGSDHPAFIEGMARLAAQSGRMPRVIVCPHEMTALSAAHGYAMITRRPQLVLVHVDVGTQNLGGSVHNAARGRVPAIIVAGLSPVTDGGARTGTRNEFIHYIQDTPRQHEIVGPYVKWSYELRAPEMVDGVLRRAVQLARTPPEGPVYLTGAREVWDGRVPVILESNSQWSPARLGGLPPADVDSLYRALTAAQRPIVITAYLGRRPEAVSGLVALSDWFGVGVCEVSPQYFNFPGHHPHHLSYRRNTLVDEADLILMLDVDVPWINSRVQPAKGARIFHIDVDPVKPGLGYWNFTVQHVYHAACACVLDQLLAVDRKIPAGREQRLEWIAAARRRLVSSPEVPGSGPITAEELTAAVRELVTERTIVLFEEPASTELIPPILRLNTAGSFFHSGGAGLGFAINGAVGAKLARPDAEVISLVGDGCYLFGVPSSAYWVARAYGTPHLTVIYNNGGWHSPKLSTQWVHPDGVAQKNGTFWVTMAAGARLADIAAAGDAEAYQVEARDALKFTLRRALETVRAGRCAVVDVTIASISQQVLSGPTLPLAIPAGFTGSVYPVAHLCDPETPYVHHDAAFAR